MFIAFVSFSTSRIGEYGDQQISVIIYGVNISIVGFWEYILWRYATKDHRLLDSDLDSRFITIVSRFLLGPIIYLIVVVISFVSTQVNLVLFISTPLYFIVSAKMTNLNFGLPKISK